jgi:hypothetical protein
MHHGNDLHLLADDPVEYGMGEAVEDEPPSDAWFDFWPAFRRLENGADALFDRRLEPFRSGRVVRQVPKERGNEFHPPHAHRREAFSPP